MRRIPWRQFQQCFDAIASRMSCGGLSDGAAIQQALVMCTAGHPYAAECVLGVPCSSIAFLEYLFHRAGGPYSPEFEWIAPVIQIFLVNSPDISRLLNLNAPDALANMVLNKRGRLKFLISDQCELEIILLWWERFGLSPVTSRMVFDAVMSKPTIRERIKNGDPLLILRLLDVFPQWAGEVNPKGFSREVLLHAAGSITRPPSERRYHQVYVDALKKGRDIHSLIKEEERRTLPMQMRRNRYLAYLVRTLHGNVCQICAAMGLSTTGPVHVHHIVPLSFGGPDRAANMIVLCPLHHQSVHEGKISIIHKENQVFVSCGEHTFLLPTCSCLHKFGQ